MKRGRHSKTLEEKRATRRAYYRRNREKLKAYMLKRWHKKYPNALYRTEIPRPIPRLKRLFPEPKPVKEPKFVYKESTCFWCGLKFSYRVPQTLVNRRGKILSIEQIYCSPQCENEHRQQAKQIEKLSSEMRVKTIKACPACGLIPKENSLAWCPRCHEKFIRKEVIELEH